MKKSTKKMIFYGIVAYVVYKMFGTKIMSMLGMSAPVATPDVNPPTGGASGG